MTLTADTLLERGYLGPLDRRFAGLLARLGDERDPLVLLGAAVASRHTGHKHVCVALDRIGGRPVVDEDGAPVGDLTWPAATEWKRALARSVLVGNGDQVSPLVLDEAGRLYLYRYWSYERRLLDELARRMAADGPALDRELLARGLEREFPAGAGAAPDRQRQAAELVLARRLAVISGGPGTGKTATVARILALVIEQALARGADPPRIALLAPTGKAAARLSESIGRAKRADTGAVLHAAAEVQALIPEQAATIHRSLGWQPRTPTAFRQRRENPLPADVVVVDEASMVDLALLTKLVEAVPARARLIVLGDRDQLASVDAGAAFGDICGAGVATGGRAAAAIDGHLVHLTHSYRFDAASPLGQLAQAINAGRDEDALALLNAAPDGALRLVEPGGNDGLGGAIARLAVDRYRPVLGAPDPVARLAALERFRVLCAHRRGPTGAERVNRLIEGALLGGEGAPAAGDWYPGRPVLVVENDYQANLFNGDVGVVDREPGGGQLRAFFEGGGGALRSLAPSRLPPHETVYAMTVHKSQGSEFDEVVVVLPDRPSPVVTRELLYTAVTRARERVTIVATTAILRAAIAARVERSSGLRDALWGGRGASAAT